MALGEHAREQSRTVTTAWLARLKPEPGSPPARYRRTKVGSIGIPHHATPLRSGREGSRGKRAAEPNVATGSSREGEP